MGQKKTKRWFEKEGGKIKKLKIIYDISYKRLNLKETHLSLELQKLWYFHKTFGLAGGETCPCCYDLEWCEITARGDWGAGSFSAET